MSRNNPNTLEIIVMALITAPERNRRLILAVNFRYQNAADSALIVYKGHAKSVNFLTDAHEAVMFTRIKSHSDANNDQ